MVKIDLEINKFRSAVLEKIGLIDRYYSALINSLFEADLRREANEADDNRKRMKAVQELILRRRFNNKNHLVVLKTLLIEVEWIEKQIDNLKTMISSFDGSDNVLNYLKDLGFSIEIIKESVGMNSKMDLMRLFKKKKLSGMNSFYVLIKWDQLDRGLPNDYSRDQKMLDGTPIDLRKKREDRNRLKFFATTKDDIAQSAVDFFSIGHILMGQCFFFIFYALAAPSPPNVVSAPFEGSFNWMGLNYSAWSVIFAILVGIIWEPIENIILWKIGMKFEDKRDSYLNIIFDIIFVGLGALIGLIYDGFWFHLGLIIIEMILFFILRWYFLNKR